MERLSLRRFPDEWTWREAAVYVSPVSYFDPPSLFAQAMAETIPIEPHKTALLDVGCGSGIIGIYCLIAKKAALVTFSDIQKEALYETHGNITRQIELGRVNGSQVAFLDHVPFAAIPDEIVAKHDLICFNAPQLPLHYLDETAKQKLTASDIQVFFRSGGADGLAVVREFFYWYSRLKQPKPPAIVVLSSFIGRRLIDETVRAAGLVPSIIKETDLPLRKFLTNRAAEFAIDPKQKEDRSLSTIERDGETIWMKKLLTIRLTAQ